MERAEKNRIIGVILGFLQGIAIGVSGVLPGISGGVLCIVFGIYKPFMEILASPFAAIKRYWRRLLPVGLGAAAGFFMLVEAISTLIELHEGLATAAFAGLILGTLPSLVRAAGREPRRKTSYIALAASFVVFFVLFGGVSIWDGLSVTPSFVWYIIAGAIWGISIVLPGISSSAILIFLGLFAPIADAAVNFDLSVLIPLAIGGVGALVLLSRLINMLFERHYSVMSHIIVGIVVATTLPILPYRFDGLLDAFLKLALVIGGIAVAILFDRISEKIQVAK